MTGFSAASCFSPAHTASTRQHALPPPAPKPIHLNFLAALIAFLAKMKPTQGGSPKKIVLSVSNKALKLVHKKGGRQEDDDEALWRRSILLGDKCQPLDFSGVIYYDERGQQISELPPRSPRSPLPSYLQSRSDAGS